MKLPKHIEHWDDERNLDHGIIVTLKQGLSFYPNEHLGVMGFDTVTEARAGSRLKAIYRCACPECQAETKNKEDFVRLYTPCFNFELDPDELIAEGLKRGFITKIAKDLYLINKDYK